jgi:hypothetical protein
MTEENMTKPTNDEIDAACASTIHGAHGTLQTENAAMTDRVTRIGIQIYLDEALSHMDGLAPSEAAMRNALEEIESRVIRLRLAVLMRGLEGAKALPR